MCADTGVFGVSQRSDVCVCADTGVFGVSQRSGVCVFKVQGSLLFVTYTIIQGIIGSEMLVGTGPLNGKCKKEK